MEWTKVTATAVVGSATDLAIDWVAGWVAHLPGWGYSMIQGLVR